MRFNATQAILDASAELRAMDHAESVSSIRSRLPNADDRETREFMAAASIVMATPIFPREHVARQFRDKI